MKDIKVILLTAGISKRLWPLQDKHFIQFLGKPLIYHSLLQLQRFGFRDFILVINKENKTKFENIKIFFQNIKIEIIEQNEIPGMVGAVLSAKKQIAGNKVLIVGPSDIYEDIIFTSFSSLLRCDPDGIISGKQMKQYFPGAYLKIKKGNIVSITEKPKEEEIPSNVVSFVFDYFNNADSLISTLENFKKNKEDGFEKALDSLVKKGAILKLLNYNGYWGFIKYPWHILAATDYFLGKIQKTKYGREVIISPKSVVSGNVYLEDGVRVLENAKIIGPSYIGKGTIVGNGALIRESMVGDYNVLGFGTEIARSYIGNNCWFHSNYVGDSVIADNVAIGAGSVLANFRLDEKVIKSRISNEFLDTGKIKLGAAIGENVRIGVNVSIMPGVKIVRDCFLGAGVVLDKDLPDDKYCALKSGQYTVKDNLNGHKNSRREKQRASLRF